MTFALKIILKISGLNRLERNWTKQYLQIKRKLKFNNNIIETLNLYFVWYNCIPVHKIYTLFELHWLPIEYRLKFKMRLHVFKVINNLSPTYLTDLITHQPVPSRSLRSTDSNLLFVQRTFLLSVIAALVYAGHVFEIHYHHT